MTRTVALPGQTGADKDDLAPESQEGMSARHAAIARIVIVAACSGPGSSRR